MIRPQQINFMDDGFDSTVIEFFNKKIKIISPLHFFGGTDFFSSLKITSVLSFVLRKKKSLLCSSHIVGNPFLGKIKKKIRKK